MDNRGFLDILNVGCNDLNWGGTPNCSPIGEQEMMQTQDVSASAKPRSTRAPSAKGKNWSSAEDKVLIEAWGNTSLDAVTGTDQNSHSYWGRIADYYKAHKQPSWPERNANALNCRFTGISSSTSKFCGCVQQILNKEESGRTIDEKQNDAHIMYKELDPKKKPFTLMHCYVELEKYPKWQTRPSSQKKQKKTSDASPGTTSNDEEFEVCTDALENEKRPRGTKHEKERRGKAHVSDGSGCKLSLETVWAQKLEKDDIKEAAKSARYARAFELQEQQIALQVREDARKQFELEEKIMFMDTTGMTVAQKQFYKDKQDEIVARRPNTSA